MQSLFEIRGTIWTDLQPAAVRPYCTPNFSEFGMHLPMCLHQTHHIPPVLKIFLLNQLNIVPFSLFQFLLQAHRNPQNWQYTLHHLDVTPTPGITLCSKLVYLLFSSDKDPLPMTDTSICFQFSISLDYSFPTTYPPHLVNVGFGWLL